MAWPLRNYKKRKNQPTKQSLPHSNKKITPQQQQKLKPRTCRSDILFKGSEFGVCVCAVSLLFISCFYVISFLSQFFQFKLAMILDP